MTRTLKLRAQGLRHSIAFDRQVISFKTPLNRVIAAALDEVERIAHLVDLGHKTLASARAMAVLFADCRDAETLFGDRRILVRTTETLQTKEKIGMRADLLALAAVILSHESFELNATSDRRTPRSWFLNLETLYETAVRRLLSDAYAPVTSVRNGRTDALPIFSTPDVGFSANPDLVIETQGVVHAVGDVKYKAWAGTAGASDLYQLLVHASAFRARTAFLIYAGDSYDYRDLGESSDGIRTLLFSADPRRLQEHLHLVRTAVGPNTTTGVEPHQAA